MENRHVHSLWVGNELSRLEVLTIQSFLWHGHSFNLWVYSKPRGVPPEVIIHDAGEIIPEDLVFRRQENIPGLTTGRGSLGPFSDLFRFKLLYGVGGWWVDMDMTCLRPLHFSQEYVFRPHHSIEVVGNIFKCPRHCDLMKKSYQEVVQEIDGSTIDWLAAQRIFSRNVELCGLLGFRRELCNRDIWQDILPYMQEDRPIPNEWHVFHWCNERWRGEGIDKNNPQEGSTLARLTQRYGA